LLASLGRENFAPLVGQRFSMRTEAGRRLTLVLTDVRAYRAPATARATQARLDGFTLVFRGAAAPPAQGTYQMEHPRLGSFPLFVVPHALARGGAAYVAVFNRLQA
jgi:hypothetical protein